MMAISGDSIDQKMLEKASEKLGLTDTWEKVQTH